MKNCKKKFYEEWGRDKFLFSIYRYLTLLDKNL